MRMPTLRTSASCLALFAALGLASTAQALPMTPDCPGSSGAPQTSAVTSAAEQLDSGNWLYSYRVCNTSTFDPYYGGQFVIIDWELPWFEDAAISNIVVPHGWAAAIEEIGSVNPATGWEGVAEWQTDGDPWKDIFDAAYGSAADNPFNTVQHVLHFFWTGNFEGEIAPSSVDEDDDSVPALAFSFSDEFCESIFEGEECFGFGFESPFSAGDAPYQASWLFLPVNTGDPLFPLGDGGGGIPNSPSIQRTTTSVPEPTTLAILGAALPLLALRRRRRS